MASALLRTVRGFSRTWLQDIGPEAVTWTTAFVPSRCASFQSSNPVGDLAQYPEVEILRNPPEWKFVDRLIARPIVARPTVKDVYPSGWQPLNSDKIARLPYFVARTKNHMSPVYLDRTFRGQRHVTKVRRIHGNIWQLEADLREEIQKNFRWELASRVNEMSGQITFKGDFVTVIQKFLADRGL